VVEKSNYYEMIRGEKTVKSSRQKIGGLRPQAGGDQPGPPRRALHGRTAGVQPRHPGNPQAAAGGRFRLRLTRAARSSVFPSSFMFVAAMNPCPCGYYTDPNRNCRCSPSKIERYAGKGDGETSAAIKEKLRGIVHYRS